jgi:hypothetical protein
MSDEKDPQAEAVARGDVLSEPTEEPQESAQQEQLDLEKPPAEEPPEEPKAAAEDDKADDEPKEHKIPKSRFDEAVQKERAEKAELANRLQQYQQRDQQLKEAENFEASEAKVKELLKQHSSLLADGDLDKASEVMGAVLQLRDDMQNVRMEKRADNARNSAKIEVQYDATVDRLEAEYPEINPDSDAFDQTAVRRVQMMVTGLMQNEGKNPAEALQEATDILLKPAKEAKGKDLRDKPSEEAVEKGMRRTQQQIDKNIKANNQQPPSAAEVGQDHDTVGGPLDYSAVQAMTFEEFVNVPDDELAKIRGDYLN